MVSRVVSRVVEAVEAFLPQLAWEARADRPGKHNPRYYATLRIGEGGPFEPVREVFKEALGECNIAMYLIWTAPGGQHFAHGDGARGGKAGYQARYVMKVGGDEGSTGSIRLRMAGEEERCIPYQAAYIMDPTTGSLPNKHRVAPVKDNTCVLVVSVYRTDLTYDDIVGAIVAKSVERLQPFSLADAGPCPEVPAKKAKTA